MRGIHPLFASQRQAIYVGASVPGNKPSDVGARPGDMIFLNWEGGRADLPGGSWISLATGCDYRILTSADVGSTLEKLPNTNEYGACFVLLRGPQALVRRISASGMDFDGFTKSPGHIGIVTRTIYPAGGLTVTAGGEVLDNYVYSAARNTYYFGPSLYLYPKHPIYPDGAAFHISAASGPTPGFQAYELI
ncbi:hypothetical protein [uncultured Sphingomonas sp.]|uniref:hypothetical protein n=1 Tax=uncultured Sphingomonas sp. TaxID=158754 RepID=UPI0025F3D901|nr:hypothetical protein [uncultured Sphingomonas sp.]